VLHQIQPTHIENSIVIMTTNF